MNAIVQFRARDQEDADVTALTAIMEACSESLAILEAGCVLRANRAFARTFGYVDSSEVQGRDFTAFVAESDFLFPSGEETSASIRNQGLASIRECSAILKNGARVRLEVACVCFCVSRRNLFAINVRDLPESKQETTPLSESQRMEAMGHLVGSVAHDFNNLLTGILLYCGLLIAGLEAGSSLRGYVEEIRRAGGHSAGLIQQLLSVVRPPLAGSQVMSWNQAIAEMRDLVSRLLGENIELITELAEDVSPVKMNPVSMRQILLNLLLNARDAMPDGGRIILTTRNCGSLENEECAQPGKSGEQFTGVELTIADTGCGMDAGVRAHMFEPFFTTKLVGSGNGLGLATVYRIVKQESGSIQVESEPAKGTRVTVRLPRMNSEPDHTGT